jgi:hypothetical protein
MCNLSYNPSGTSIEECSHVYRSADHFGANLAPARADELRTTRTANYSGTCRYLCTPDNGLHRSGIIDHILSVYKGSILVRA